MIEITESTINKVNSLLSNVPNGAEKVFTNAINRALSAAKTDIYKGVTKEYAISKDVLNRYTRESVKKATYSNICGTILFSGVQIPLYKYNLTSPKHPNRNIRVVAGQKSASTFEEAFVQRMRSGHLGIFKREGSDRTSGITELLGSSMRSMAGNSIVMEEVYEKAQKKLDERIEHEISRILKGYGIK